MRNKKEGRTRNCFHADSDAKWTDTDTETHTDGFGIHRFYNAHLSTEWLCGDHIYDKFVPGYVDEADVRQFSA